MNDDPFESLSVRLQNYGIHLSNSRATYRKLSFHSHHIDQRTMPTTGSCSDRMENSFAQEFSTILLFETCRLSMKKLPADSSGSARLSAQVFSVDAVAELRCISFWMLPIDASDQSNSGPQHRWTRFLLRSYRICDSKLSVKVVKFEGNPTYVSQLFRQLEFPPLHWVLHVWAVRRIGNIPSWPRGEACFWVVRCFAVAEAWTTHSINSIQSAVDICLSKVACPIPLKLFPFIM